MEKNYLIDFDKIPILRSMASSARSVKFLKIKEIEAEDVETEEKVQEEFEFSGTQNEYIEYIAPVAMDIWKEYEILPSLTIAQGIIETYFGKYAIGWNITGVKACCNRDEIKNVFTIIVNGEEVTAGECVYHEGRYKVKLWTTEEYNGELQKVKLWFAYYKTKEEFALSRYKVLSNENYYPGVIGETDYKKAVAATKRYATSSEYVSAVIKVIEDYNLTVYDPQGILYK
ncbi:MAG: glucosaminidase domain-containing protein [Endomicrobium sp.]|nr:glucosaminidase domain-containing protein [Endomicrobium sp.]